MPKGGHYEYTADLLVRAGMDEKSVQKVKQQEKKLITLMGKEFEDAFMNFGELINEALVGKGMKPIPFEQFIDVSDIMGTMSKVGAQMREIVVGSAGLDNVFDTSKVVSSLVEEKKAVESEIKLLKEREKLLKAAHAIVIESADEEKKTKDFYSYQWKTDDRSNIDAIKTEIKAEIKHYQDLKWDFNDLLYEIEEEGSTDFEAFDQHVLKMAESVSTLKSMLESIRNMPSSTSMSLSNVLDENVIGELAATDETGDETIADYLAKTLKRAGVNPSKDFKLPKGMVAQYTAKEAELESITSELLRLEQQANSTAASMDEVNEAIKKRYTGSGKNVKTAEIKQAQAAIDGTIKEDKNHTVAQYAKMFDESQSGDFVDRHKALLNFVTAYEKYRDSLSEEKQATDKTVANYKEMYENLSQHVDVARESLEKFVQTAKTAPPIEKIKDTVKSDVSGDVDDEVDNAERVAQAEKEAAAAAKERAEAEAKANARRDELVKQLDSYNKDVLTSPEADDNLQKRQEILQTLKNEGLLTEELEQSYNAINQKLETRANLLRQAEGYYDDINEELTGARVDSIDDEPQYRRDHIKPFDDTISQMQSSGFFSEEELDKFLVISDAMEEHIRDITTEASWNKLGELYDETDNITDANKLNDILEERKQILSTLENYYDYDDEEIENERQINSEIEKRISLLREAQTGSIDIDDIDDIIKETGTLESKLERLQDVSQDWGIKIKDDEIDEAEAELQEFEETYERITLKLANGKSVNILPNAKGLRQLYKYYDGIDSQAYGETEIDDVIFERVKKSAIEADAAVDDLNDSLDETNKLNSGDVVSSDTSNIDKKIQSYEELKNVVQEYIDLSKQMKHLERTPEDDHWIYEVDGAYRNATGSSDELMADFKTQWKRVEAIKKAINQHEKMGSPNQPIEYIDPEDNRAYTTSKESLKEETNKLKAMALEYVNDLGLTLDMLNKKQREFVSNTSEAYSAWQKDYDKRREPIDSYNEPYENAKVAIRNRITSDLPLNQALNVTSVLSDIDIFGAFSGSQLEKLCNYLGIEIPQAANKAEQAVENLNDELQETDNINKGTGAGTGDASSAELKAAQEEIERLRKEAVNEEGNRNRERDEWAEQLANTREEAEAAEKRAREAEEALAKMKADADGKKLVDKDAPDSKLDTTLEETQMKALKEMVESVTTAVDAKTKAFRDEADTVDNVVTAEIGSLERLDGKILEIKEKFEKLLTDISTKQPVINTPKINDKTVDVDPKTSAPSQELDDLQKLRAALQLTTKRINEKTQAFETEKAIVTNVVSSEINALNRLQTQVKDVNKIVLDLLTNIRNVQTGAANINIPQVQPTSQNNIGTQGQGTGGGKTSPTLLNAKIDTQASSLWTMYAQLDAAGKMTDELEDKWLQLWNSLGKVKDASSLQLWREELSRVKNEMKEIMIANDLLAKEGVQSFKGLIDMTKLYNEMVIKAAKAKTTEEKDFYTQEANAALVEQQRLLQSISLTKEQQAEFDKLELNRKRELNAIQSEQVGRQRQIEESQREARIVKELIDLYEQLGRAQYLGDVNEVARINVEKNVKRAQLSSVDYTTNMSFKDAKEKGYTSEKDKAEKKALKEEEVIINQLIESYKEYGVLIERAGATKGTNLGKQVADEMNSKASEIQAVIKSLKGGITKEMQQKFDAAFDKGKTIESNKQYEALARKIDKDEITRLNNIAKLEKEIGSLKADAKNTSNAGVRQALEQEIKLREQLIDLQMKGLAMSAENEAFYKRQAANVTREAQRIAAETNKDQNKAWQEFTKETRASKGVKAADSAISAGNNAVINTLGNENLSREIDSKAQELAKAVRALQDAKQDVNSAIEKGLDVDQADFNQSIKKVRELTEELEQMNAIHQKYSGDNTTIIDGDADSFKDLGLDDYEKQLRKLAEASVEGKLRQASFNTETKELTATVKTGANAFTTYSFAVDEVDGKLKKLNQGTKQTESFFESVTRKTRELATYVVGSVSIYDIWNQIKQGVQYVREIDTAMTELKKVTNETDAAYEKFLGTASKAGAKIGTTVSDYVQATSTFAKLGYNMDQASEMAKSALVYKNVGDDIESAEAAAESIISTMTGFGLEASNTMAIVDSFNEVGNRFAIDSKGIGDALQRSASAMSMAGNTMHETIGLVTAANTVVQDPEKVGK